MDDDNKSRCYHTILQILIPLHEDGCVGGADKRSPLSLLMMAATTASVHVAWIDPYIVMVANKLESEFKYFITHPVFCSVLFPHCPSSSSREFMCAPVKAHYNIRISEHNFRKHSIGESNSAITIPDIDVIEW